MHAFSTILAGLAAFSLPIHARPTYHCDWTGCGTQAVFSEPETTVSDASNVIKTLEKLDKAILDLQPLVGSINQVNAPLVVAGIGPIPDFMAKYRNEVIKVSSELIATELTDIKPITSDKDAEGILNAWRSYTTSHTLLLIVLREKIAGFSYLDFVEVPLRAIVSTMKDVHDPTVFGLTDLLETKHTEAQTLGASLSKAFEAAIEAGQAAAL